MYCFCLKLVPGSHHWRNADPCSFYQLQIIVSGWTTPAAHNQDLDATGKYDFTFLLSDSSFSGRIRFNIYDLHRSVIVFYGIYSCWALALTGKWQQIIFGHSWRCLYCQWFITLPLQLAQSVASQLFLQGWHDCNLEWNPFNYSNISNVRIAANDIWRPDIILYNKWVCTPTWMHPSNACICKRRATCIFVARQLID